MATIHPVQVKQRGASYQLVYYNPKGERRRISAGKDAQHAQRLAIKFNDWLIEGKDPEREIEQARQREQAQSITIRDLFPLFMERHAFQRGKNTQKFYRDSMKNFCRCPAIADVPISDIRKSDVIDFMKLRMEEGGVKASTVNKDLAFLKCMLAKAVEWDILEYHPLQGVKKFKEDGKRDIDLTPDEARQLIDSLPHPVDDIIEFAIYTGFRKENILSLTIESIRFHENGSSAEAELIVKGGRREIFPLSSNAVEVLKRAIGKRRSGFVFINPRTKTRYSCIHKSFDRNVEKLGLKAMNGTKLRFHDLRHVFATWLHQSGVSLDSIRHHLGHMDRSTTDRYTTVSRRGISGDLQRIPNLRQFPEQQNPATLMTGSDTK